MAANYSVTVSDNNSCTTDSCDSQTGACLNKPILGCNGYCTKDADCDDSNPDINPGVAEVCDHVDNDCDGVPDYTIGGPPPIGAPMPASAQAMLMTP